MSLPKDNQEKNLIKQLEGVGFLRGYLLKRLLSLIPVLFIVSLVIFCIIHITPGDPAAIMLGDHATEEEVNLLREQLGLNLPIYQQYLNWLLNLFKGDMGFSYFMDQPVFTAILEHLGPTISLSLLAQGLAIVIAIPIGIIAATRRGTVAEQSIMGFSLLGLSVPSFLLGLFLIIIFSVNLKWLPVAGYQPLSEGLISHIRYLTMPAVALGVIQIAIIARMTRSAMLEVLNSNFIKAARAKGVKERKVIYKYALRSAFIPILTIIGQSFGSLIAGAAVTETIFNIPGIGQLIINSVERRDYLVIQGGVLFITFSYVMINLITDLLYGVVDPRIRLNKN